MTPTARPVRRFLHEWQSSLCQQELQIVQASLLEERFGPEERRTTFIPNLPSKELENMIGSKPVNVDTVAMLAAQLGNKKLATVCVAEHHLNLARSCALRVLVEKAASAA